MKQLLWRVSFCKSADGAGRKREKLRDKEKKKEKEIVLAILAALPDKLF